MEDTCCWHLGCHYCSRELQGGPSPCPALPAVPLSSAPSSSNWVLQRLQWDCPLLGIVAKLTDLFPLTCQQSNYGGQTHRLRFCSFCLLVKPGTACDWLFCWGCRWWSGWLLKNWSHYSANKNNQFGWIKTLSGRHWVIVSSKWANVNTVP